MPIAAERLGIGTIRGSGTHGTDFLKKGGITAFNDMLAALKDGYTVALTADVPKVSRVCRARHRQARQRLRPSDLSDRDRDQPADRARQLGPHRHQSAVQPRRRRGRRADPRAGRRRRRRRSSSRAARSRRRSTPRPGAPTRLPTGPAEAAPVADRLPLTLHAYRLLTAAAAPLAELLLPYRLKRGKEHAERLPERRGESTVARPAGPLVWLHGASVGELIAILPLIERIRARDFTVLVTSGTVTSAGLAEQRLPPASSISSRRSTCRNSSPASSIIGGPISRCSSNPICGPT